jgi:homocysteine S-methyltransferase
MSADEARDYHSPQVSTFAGTSADLVSALTLNYADEATGIARAATDAGIPSVISFTRRDGRAAAERPGAA